MLQAHNLHKTLTHPMALLDNFFMEFEVRQGRISSIALAQETYDAFWQRSGEEKLFIEQASDPTALAKGFLGTIWGARLILKNLPFGVIEFTGTEEDPEIGERKEKSRSYTIFSPEPMADPKKAQVTKLIDELVKDLRYRCQVIISPEAVQDAWSQMILSSIST